MCNNGNNFGLGNCQTAILTGRCQMVNGSKCEPFENFARKNPESAAVIMAHAEITKIFENTTGA